MLQKILTKRFPLRRGVGPIASSLRRELPLYPDPSVRYFSDKKDPWPSLQSLNVPSSLPTQVTTLFKASNDGNDGDGSGKGKPENEDKPNEEKFSASEALGVIFLCVCFYFMIFYEEEEELVVTEQGRCPAKLAADKMSGKVEDCDRIERVPMTTRVPLEALTSQGISHAGLEGTLWDCRVKPQDKKCWYRQRYWNDEAAYKLTTEAAEILRNTTEELHAMCLEAVDLVVHSDELMTLFEIPENMRAAVRDSWEQRERDFLGRFDLMWDGKGLPKLAEYNADTPTILIETGLGQEIWNQQVLGGNTSKQWQFNDIEKNLIAAWKHFGSLQEMIHLVGSLDSIEEREHLHYLRLTAEKAGLLAKVIDITRLQVVNQLPAVTGSAPSSSASTSASASGSADSAFFTSTSPTRSIDNFEENRPYLIDKEVLATAIFTNPKDAIIQKVFKLYPYEWLSHEELGQELFTTLLTSSKESRHQRKASVQVIEPPWKLILGNKAILALLWDMYPNHPNLLPAYFELPREFLHDHDYVAKPKYGREGQGIVYSRTYRKKPLEPAALQAATPLSEPVKNDYKLDNQREINQSAFDQAFNKYVDDIENGITEFFLQADHNLYVNLHEANKHGPATSMLESMETPSSVYLGYPVYQQHYDTSRFSNRHIVIGSWVIGGIPSGFNFREDSTNTTQDNSCFVPHYIVGKHPENFHQVQGKRFNAQQRKFYQELYGIEVKSYNEYGQEEGESSHSTASHGRGSSSSGGGGGWFNYWFRQSSNDNQKSGESHSTGGGGAGGAGGSHSNSGTGGAEATGNPKTSTSDKFKDAASKFKQKVTNRTSGVQKTSAGTKMKVTGSSHKTVSRAGMGGARG